MCDKITFVAGVKSRYRARAFFFFLPIAPAGSHCAAQPTAEYKEGRESARASLATQLTVR